MRALKAGFLALLAAALAACAPPPPATRGPEPALWRVADADSEIWLYGTVHVLPPYVRWRGPRLEAAFAAADEFVTETDMSPAGEQAVAELAGRYGALGEGQSLSALLPDEAARERLRRAARGVGVNLEALERQRPWLAALQLSYLYAIRQGHLPEAGVESVLGADARAQGKRIDFLETPEQQVRVLADLPPQEELRFLLLTLQDIEQDGAALSAMDAAWVRGETDTLAELLDAQWQAAGPVIHEAVVLKRNRAWADDIAHRLEGSGASFIAVGAAHLVGEDSVVALLRQRGILVEGP